MVELKFSGNWEEIKNEMQALLDADPFTPAAAKRRLAANKSRADAIASQRAANIEAGLKASPREELRPAPQTQAAVALAPELESKPEPVVEPKYVPTEADVQTAVVSLNDKFGIDKCIETLAKFKVKRARELKEDQREEFIKTCLELLK